MKDHYHCRECGSMILGRRTPAQDGRCPECLLNEQIAQDLIADLERKYSPSTSAKLALEKAVKAQFDVQDKHHYLEEAIGKSDAAPEIKEKARCLLCRRSELDFMQAVFPGPLTHKEASP